MLTHAPRQKLNVVYLKDPGLSFQCGGTNISRVDDYLDLCFPIVLGRNNTFADAAS